MAKVVRQDRANIAPRPSGSCAPGGIIGCLRGAQARGILLGQPGHGDGWERAFCFSGACWCAALRLGHLRPRKSKAHG